MDLKKLKISTYIKNYEVSFSDKLSGWLLYPAADLIAQFILGQFSIYRLVILALVGRFIYANEIPRWFGFLSTWTFGKKNFFTKLFVKDNKLTGLAKTLGATIWFHPVWIARHLYSLEAAKLFEDSYKIQEFIDYWKPALSIGTDSYIAQLPVALLANHFIINVVSEKTRFFWSSIFSGSLAIYYALVQVYWG